ncbi:MAG: PQQ-like beta-propeller repeat protein [Pirellulales bacterium]
MNTASLAGRHSIPVTKRPFAALAAVLLAAAGQAAWGAEQSASQVRWGGASNSNMVSAAKKLPADPGSVEPLWKLRLGSHQYSIPTIDRGRIYTATDDAGVSRPGVESTGGGLVTCVDQATAKLIWQLPVPRYFEGVTPPYHFDQWKCGVCSGPLVDGNRVYVIGSRGEVLCLDREGQANGNDGPFQDELAYFGLAKSPGAKLEPTDGDIIWSYNLIRELDVVLHDVCGSTLLMQGDFLYACTSNGIDDRHDKVPKPLAPSLIVLDKKTGRLVAKDDERVGQRMFHCNWSSPALGEVNGQTLVFFGAGDGVLYAFQPPKASEGAAVQTLKKVWSCDCNPPSYRTRDGKPLPYSTHSSNRVDGPSEIIGSPVFHAGRVYVAIGQSPIHGVGNGSLSCIDAATGKKLWSSEKVDRTTATPSIADGLLYIPDYTGNLHCLDAQTGEQYWVHPLGAKTWCASALVADGKVYAATDAKVLWTLKAAKEKQVLSKARLQSVATTPTAADGVLYVPTQREVIAIPGRTTASALAK